MAFSSHSSQIWPIVRGRTDSRLSSIYHGGGRAMRYASLVIGGLLLNAHLSSGQTAPQATTTAGNLAQAANAVNSLPNTVSPTGLEQQTAAGSIGNGGENITTF